MVQSVEPPTFDFGSGHALRVMSSIPASVNQVNKCWTVGLGNYTLHVPASRVRGFHFLSILDNTFFSLFLWVYPSYRCEMVCQLWFWFAFSRWPIILSIFSRVFIGHLHSLFGELPHQIICPFFSLVILSLYYCVVRVLYNSRYQPLYQRDDLQIFLLILWVCLLTFLSNPYS